MHRNPRVVAALAAALLALAGAPPAQADNRYCGGAVAQTTPNDLANVVGELTIEHTAQQPASLVTCAMGYLIAKCGDYETANAVFDKCIAAGYVGAMIWKGLLYENGDGVPQDHAQAAAMFKRAAESGNSDYATLGKLHYATALQLGRGVPRDEAAARRLFEQAAAEGSAEAQEFLRTGYHSGDRDVEGVGAGVRPAWADAAGRGLLDPGVAARAAERDARGVAARRLVPAGAAVEAAPPAASAAHARIELAAAAVLDEQLREHVSGQRLAAVAPDDGGGVGGRASAWFAAALAAAVAAGALGQVRRARATAEARGRDV